MKTSRISIVCFWICLCLVPFSSGAQDRMPLSKPVLKKIKIEFNGERLTGMYDYIDARSASEKIRDTEKGYLAGSVIVFLSGHGQRPSDAFKFVNDMACNSKSGIVIEPVCDTPYGQDKTWRGDRGKYVVLMEMVRYILSKNGIAINDYQPISNMSVKIEKNEIQPVKRGVNASLSVVGWSHGGLLARRIASAYPDAVCGLGQVCPAGYENWRFGSISLISNFIGESLHISLMLFTKKAPDVLRGGFGLTKGIVGDSVRGTISGIGHFG